MPQDTWLTTVKKISRYHKKELKLNQIHSQKDTADALGIDPKVVSMCLTIYPWLNDPYVKEKLGLRGAYQEILSRKRLRKEHLVARLLT